MPQHPPTVIRPLPEASPQARPENQIQGDRWRLTVLTPSLFRLEWSPDGGFEDRASTFAIRRDLPQVEFSVKKAGRAMEVTTERAVLRYDGEAFSAAGLSVTLRGADLAGAWRYGEWTPNLGGTARTLDDVDGRLEPEPGIMSLDGVALIDDSESFLFEEDGWVATRETGHRDLYIFAAGRDYQMALQDFYSVSGAPTLLPRWALGNWWSRYHAYSETSYLDLLDRFDAEDLPFSVAVIDMDWHRVDSVPEEYGNGWTGYSWEKSLFPHPERFLSALHGRGLRATLNLHPADGIRPFEDAYASMAQALGLASEAMETIPFDPTDRAFLQAYFEHLHHPHEDLGVDFWWIDWQQGRVSSIPGIDPLWMLNHYHHLDAARAGGPGMVFSRYAGPGSHRYAVGFSGDTVISWDSLRFQSEFTATASNIGYCWWSHDIGGHTRGVRDNELATRWTQLGVFSPVTRLHSANNPFIRKEPWKFPEEHRKAMGQALRLRHRLVPYLHTMNHHSHAGQPLVRPMYYLYPRAPEAYEVPHQYAFGTELLVAPVTEPRDEASLLASTNAWLPPGDWTDVFTGMVYAGGRPITFHRPLDSIPVLLRAGGILPLGGEQERDITRNPEAVEILVATGDDGIFTLIEDHPDHPGKDLTKTDLAWEEDSAIFRVGNSSAAQKRTPTNREWTITFFGQPSSSEVFLNGESLEVHESEDRFSVRFCLLSDAEGEIVLDGGPPQRGVDPIDRVLHVLEQAQAENAEKLRAWSLVDSDRPLPERIASLQTARLPPGVRAAATELLGSVRPEEPKQV